MADSAFICDGDAQNFKQVVLQASFEAPVLVDFWAEWCQPCKALMPLLARLADAYQGGFRLVKINTDQQQAVAQHFAVRSIPTVKVFREGQVVDEFTGVKTEGEIRAIIDRHRIRRTETYRQQALALYAGGDTEAGTQLMGQVLQHEPDFYEAALELASMWLQLEQADAAEAVLAAIPATATLDKDLLKQLQAQLKLLKLRGEVSGDAAPLEQRLAANPDDLEAMLELAKLRVASDQVEAGLELYFRVHQQDSKFQDGAGKKGLFSTFELIGAANPLVKKYRNKLFSMLY